MADTFTLQIHVSYPKRVKGCHETTVELNFRLPRGSLAKLNQINGVAVRARTQNHVLHIVTPDWAVYRQPVLNLIADANGNALREKTMSGRPGYDVEIVEEVLQKRTTLLTAARRQLQDAH